MESFLARSASQHGQIILQNGCSNSEYVLSPILTVASVCNNGKTGDIHLKSVSVSFLNLVGSGSLYSWNVHYILISLLKKSQGKSDQVNNTHHCQDLNPDLPGSKPPLSHDNFIFMASMCSCSLMEIKLLRIYWMYWKR